MTRPIPKADLARTQQLVPAPQLKPNIPQDIEDRNFGLPSALHTIYFGLFLAYLGIMFVGFQSPQMILPMAIFVLFTVAFYVVPMLWTRLKPEGAKPAMTMQALNRNGIMTHTGWCSGRDAAVQALTMPALIVGWGIAVVTVAATV